jgi:hypothetical protein
LKARLRTIVILDGLSDDGKVSMAEIGKIPRQLVKGLAVIRAHARAICPWIINEGIHVRDLGFLKKVREMPMMRLANEQEGINAALYKLANLIVFLLGVVFGTCKQKCIAILGQLALQGLNCAGKITMRKRRKYGPDRPGAMGRERTSRTVRHPAQMTYDRCDARPQLLGD